MQYTVINEQIIETNQAGIPADDRSFRLGDGLFETIHVRDGVPYLWDRHMMRLNDGLEMLRIPPHYHHSFKTLRQMADKIIAANALCDGTLRIAVSRGSGSMGYLPIPSNDTTASLVVMQTHTSRTPRHFPINADDLSAIESSPEQNMLYVSQWRKTPPECLPTECKTSQGMNSMLARMEAQDHNCAEALMLTLKDQIAECSAANIFWMRGNTLYTPSLDTGCLAGITRKKVMELTHRKVQTGIYSFKHLLKADAVFITNSSYLLKPIHGIFEFDVQFPASDKLADKMRLSFEQDIEQYITSQQPDDDAHPLYKPLAL